MNLRTDRTCCALILSLSVAAAQAEESSRIRLNTVGYLPDQPKVASVLSGAGRFEVVRTGDGAAVFAGKLAPAALNVDTQEQLAAADFSPLTEPGEYVLDVEGAGESAPFRIARDVYEQPFYLVCRGMYLWRCGTAVSAEYQGRIYGHEACHLDDAWSDFVGGGHQRRPSVGGWHDAGDYNKYVVNAGVTVGVMLRAWEDFAPQIQRVSLDLPESHRALPDFLAEVKWELDWLLSMQADDGSAYHKVSTQKFGGFILPEAEHEPRFFVPWSSAATADLVAMTAMASRHYAAYDQAYADKCLQAARKSYEFLRTHPEYHRADQRGFQTGGYEVARRGRSPVGGGRVVGCHGRRRDSGGARVAAGGPVRRGDDRRELGLGQCQESRPADLPFLTAAGRDATLVEKVRTSLIAAADQHVAAAAEHGYARPLGTLYYWGCNGTVARQTLVLEAARRLTGDARYRAAEVDALNHLLGRNYYGRSFVTGLGVRPPLHPHDRRSGADDVAEPWPGYLVGGANPKAADWHDVEADYRTNEIAINWNAALIYALAAQLPGDETN